MFTYKIEKFNKRFEAIEQMIVVLTSKVMDTHLDTMSGINAVLKTFASQSDAYAQSMSMFEVCAKAFKQVKDACETLREELSEATGTIVDSTYND